jgi:molecular chaperone DnaK
VTFDIDANGILHVAAQEKATGQKQAITITNSGNLNREEIEKMVREAEMNAEADRKSQEVIEVRNKSEQLIYSTERTMREAGDKISEAQKGSAMEKIAELNKALKGEDVSEIQEKFNDLERESHAIADQLYKAASDSGAAATSQDEEPVGAAAGHAGGEDVIDAEFKEEK